MTKAIAAVFAATAITMVMANSSATIEAFSFGEIPEEEQIVISSDENYTEPEEEEWGAKWEEPAAPSETTSVSETTAPLPEEPVVSSEDTTTGSVTSMTNPQTETETEAITSETTALPSEETVTPTNTTTGSVTSMTNPQTETETEAITSETTALPPEETVTPTNTTPGSAPSMTNSQTESETSNETEEETEEETETEATATGTQLTEDSTENTTPAVSSNTEGTTRFERERPELPPLVSTPKTGNYEAFYGFLAALVIAPIAGWILRCEKVRNFLTRNDK